MENNEAKNLINGLLKTRFELLTSEQTDDTKDAISANELDLIKAFNDAAQCEWFTLGSVAAFFGKAMMHVWGKQFTDEKE